MVLCFLFALLSPVPARISRSARYFVIGGTLVLTTLFLGAWYKRLVLFEREEAYGLAWVMEGAEMRTRFHYVKQDPGSKYFAWRSFWHIEKVFMGDTLGQAADTGAINATCPI